MTFAHFWGIDEVGIYVIPALLAIVSLRWVEKRFRRRAEQGDHEPDTEEADSLGTTDRPS